MCLWVKKSSMLKPIPFMETFKFLRLRDAVGNSLRYAVPYRHIVVPFGDGHYEADDYKQPQKELARKSMVEGGFLHSMTRRGFVSTVPVTRVFDVNRQGVATWDRVAFQATAIDVHALGDNHDMVSKGLYIPAFDLRNYTDEEVVKLRRMYSGSFTHHTTRVLKALGRPLPR